MSYKLKGGEKLSRGIRRIERRRVERIVEELVEQRPERRAKAIHKTRKDLKKARAVLRLIRDKLDAGDYRKENRHFHKVAQAVARRRDAEVVLKTVDMLRERRPDRRTSEALGRLHGILLQRREELFRRPPPMEKVKAELKAARRQIKNWRLGGLEWADLTCGIRRSYKRSLKAFQEAERTRAPEHLHEWRKRVKDLWYQFCVLQSSLPAAMARRVREMKRLSEFLGDDHDLVLFKQAARSAELGKQQMKLLEKLADAQREKLEQAAFELGHRLFAEKPAAFARRIKRYGKKWRCR